MKNKAIHLSIVGNTLEYYDFTIFAIFSAQIGQCFFPPYSESAQILLALMVFAVGFLARPFGGLVFGHIGDKYGRKVALTTSILIMALPTFLVGILPGFDQLGIFSPVLLLILRLIQGISIGGEGAGTAIFVVEHHYGKKAGFWGGVVTASYFLGALMAMGVGLLISFLSQFFLFINWRSAFILGGIIGFLGMYLRSKATETPIFKESLTKKRDIKIPFLALLMQSKKKILLTILLGGICGSVAYFVIAYMNLFLTKTIELETNQAFLYAMVGIGSCIVFLPIFGYLSDKTNHEQFFKFACYGLVIFIVPLFMLISTKALILPCVIALGILSASICAPAYAIMLKLFSVEQRYSGIGFSFNLGLTLFGGTTPMIASFLTQKSELTYSPALYLMMLTMIFIVYHTLFYKKDNLTKPIKDRNSEVEDNKAYF